MLLAVKNGLLEQCVLAKTTIKQNFILQEMEKVVQSLQSENQRLQTLFASTSSQDSCESYKSVDDEVQDVHDVRYKVVNDNNIFCCASPRAKLSCLTLRIFLMSMIRRGKLCRKCLNVVDATPANLIGTAFQMMGETANQEVITKRKRL